MRPSLPVTWRARHQSAARFEAYQRNFEPTERPSYLGELEPILDDRAALRAFVRNADAKERLGFFGIADALGESELALVSVRAIVDDPSYLDFRKYWQLWLIPYSGVRTLPGFKALLREAGIVDYWRKAGKWGDFCKPVGVDDFECR